MAANFNWSDSRLDAQRPVSRTFALPSPAAETLAEVVGARSNARRREFTIPSWVVFSMIMLATFAVCITVTMRTHAARGTAEQKYLQMETEVQSIRDRNASLRRDVERLRTDRSTQEAAARASLNMVRANEIVVPLD